MKAKLVLLLCLTMGCHWASTVVKPDGETKVTTWALIRAHGSASLEQPELSVSHSSTAKARTVEAITAIFEGLPAGFWEFVSSITATVLPAWHGPPPDRDTWLSLMKTNPGLRDRLQTLLEAYEPPLATSP